MIVDLTLDLNEILIDDKLKNAGQKKILESGHLGTHIDTHLKTEIPIEYIHHRGLLFDVSAITDRDVELEDVNLDSVCAGDCIIFKTDQIIKYPYGSRDYFHEHPQLSEKLIDALIDKKIHIIAIDAAGIRRGREHIMADKRCEEHGIYVVENIHQLDRLSQLEQGVFQVHLMWLNLPGKTGLPCRMVVDTFHQHFFN